MKSSRSTKQIEAEKRYEEKRKNQARLPSVRLSDEEKLLAESVFKLFDGSKKDAVISGLKLLLKQLEVDVQSKDIF